MGHNHFMKLFLNEKLVGVKRLSGECGGYLRAGVREDKLTAAERGGVSSIFRVFMKCRSSCTL